MNKQKKKEKSKHRAMSSYLPQEIIINILSRLPVKSILRFRCVCKSWCNLLSSHDFVKMQLDHALEKNNNNSSNNCSLMINVFLLGFFCSIDSVLSSSSELCYEAVEIDSPFRSTLLVNILGSCNGLLCGGTDFGDTFFIWNPSTKEYKENPLPPSPSFFCYVAYGFGYDCKKDDYKLVRILRFPLLHDNLEVNVYTLGSNSWRNVQGVPSNLFAPKEQVGLLLNGALHWIEATGSKVIVSFDICDESFQEIEIPQCLLGETSNVGVLRGDLCVIDHIGDSVDVWVMKDYGVIESWT